MAEQQFTQGQRWISNTEPDLGLGALTKTEGRTLTLLFLASGELRTYAKDNAPLTRVQFLPGDLAESHQGWKLQVHSVAEHNGLLTYSGLRENGVEAVLPEGELSNFIQFGRPQERLFAGQLDSNRWFELRHQTLEQRQRLEQSELIGLGGVRTELLLHQLYIAHEVGMRLAPRVLLADEVGLGKTIEACLILHRQLLTGRAGRALIVVPSPLLHQWLVELIRRFNLHFSLFDEERCQAIESSDRGNNPFHAEQLILCGLDLLTENPQRRQQAEEGEWDILIVDEAHHLEWREGNASPAYRAIEALAARIPGVLLLTATPEQLGCSGHFARLRLLDPDRFFSLAAFRKEEEGYQPVADAVTQLLSEEALSEAATAQLLKTLGEDQAIPFLQGLGDQALLEEERQAARAELIDLLLDRHGTGRVLFRNTRDRIKGFTERELHSYPLPLPSAYRLADVKNRAADLVQLLHPETVYRSTDGRAWWQFDPRIDWLIATLKKLDGSKMLLICALAETAKGLEEALRTREGIHAGLFHEGMSIVERDRAAAWFADSEQGCQLMICSEIGSEGRNFQFAHHLTLFDLPSNPDLLEQRIGRLDRIGQQSKVQIHVPYFTGGAQAVMLRWYHQGLNAFRHTCPSGQQILAQLCPALVQSMEEGESEPDALELLIETTQQLHREISLQLKNGRDHLLELNSCRGQDAEILKEAIEIEDASSALRDYMDNLFTAYGIETEHHSAGSQILKQTSRMQREYFPGLPEEGLTITYKRNIALTNEDRQFLTWEHPMVRDSMEMVLNDEMGNSCATAVHHPNLTAGTLLLELIFVLECPAPKALQAGRFLPSTLLRLLVNQELAEVGSELPHEVLNQGRQRLGKHTARKIITPLRTRIRAMLEKGEELVELQRQEITETALLTMQQRYASELDRLTALQRVNPNVREDELASLRAQQEGLDEHLRATRVRLDGLRLVVAV